MNTTPSIPPTTRRESFVDGLTVRIDERGSGRPALVLHGGGGPSSVAGFASALAEQARVLTPVHPGFEGEPRPEWFTDVDDIAVTYLELLERLDLRDVMVVGFSFGGWIAAELAVRDTNRLSGLILVDSAGIQVEGHDFPAFPPSPAPGAFPGGPANQPPAGNIVPQSPEQTAARAATFQALSVYGRNGLYDPKLRRRLARVKIPALVVWGENDPLMKPDYGRAYAQSFPNARFALIPEAGHMPQMQQPELVLTVVREFVDSIPASSVAGSPKE